jgi:tetratricopeptide (TPR) repeat protein
MTQTRLPTVKDAGLWLERLENIPRTNLSQHEDELYGAINSALNKDLSLRDGFDLLTQVYPHFALVLGQVERWLPLLYDALQRAQTVGDSQMQVQILTLMGDTFVFSSKATAAHQTFQMALQRAQEEQTPDRMLDVYIGIIKLQGLNPSAQFNKVFVQEVLRLEREVDNIRQTASLYQALALGYLYHGEVVQAVEYGQMALGIWFKLADKLQIGRTACLLATIYRVDHNYDQASRWLELAEDQLLPTEYRMQDAVLAYEIGAVHLGLKEYLAAAQWLEIALYEYQRCNLPNYVTAARHALGLAQLGLKEYEGSRRNLTQALVDWRLFSNRLEETNVLLALGCLEQADNHHEAARDYLNQAADACKVLPSTALTRKLEAEIRNALDNL